MLSYCSCCEVDDDCIKTVLVSGKKTFLSLSINSLNNLTVILSYNIHLLFQIL